MEKGKNEGFIQIQGPFNTEIDGEIITDLESYQNIESFRIQAKSLATDAWNNAAGQDRTDFTVGLIVKGSGEDATVIERDFRIGNNEMIEFNNVKLKYIKFKKEQSNNVLVDILLNR